MDAKIIFRDDAICIAHWHNMQVTDLTGVMVMAHLPEIDRAHKILAKTYPGAIAGIGLMYAGTPVSDAETRNRSAVMMKEWGASVRHLAMVLEGGGVWASTMRTIIRGMNVLSRSSHPTSVHESVASAARVLAPIVREVARVEVAESGVTAMIDALRAERRGRAAGAAGR